MKDLPERLKRECITVEGVANLDVERESSTGIPEVILARGKEPEDVYTLAITLLEKKGHVIITKADSAHFERLEDIDALKNFNRKAGVAVLKKEEVKKTRLGKVAILAAGTSDIPVAEEARIVLEELGCSAMAAYDIGIAGMHRLFPWIEKISEE